MVFRVDKDTKQHVNISGGPLAYRYQFEEIYIHYGTENSQGSEHHIQGYSFPGEVRTHLSNNVSCLVCLVEYGIRSELCKCQLMNCPSLGNWSCITTYFIGDMLLSL